MCQNYIALLEAVQRSRPEGVLIMTNFGSINSKLKTKMALHIKKLSKPGWQRYLTIFIFKSGGHVCLFLLLLELHGLGSESKGSKCYARSRALACNKDDEF
jgi:hypothetical protein